MLKNFRVHLPRYLAVAGAISLGVVCFALSLSTGNVMDRSIRDFEEKNAALHSGYVKGADRALLEELAQDPRLENVYAQYKLGQFTLTVGDSTAELPEKYPMSRATEQMSYGSMPRRGAGEIALTPSLAAKFSRDIQNLPGKTLLLTWEGGSRELTVSGIYNAGYDDFFVSSDLEQEMYEGMTGEFYSLSYDAKAFADIVTVARELTARGIPVRSAEKEASAFLETFQNLNRLFRTVSALAFSVGLFISAVLLAKQQNTRFREVGLLAALGYPAWAIRRILLGESLLLSCLAAAFTGLLSLAAALAAGAAGFPLVLTMPQAAASLGGTAVIILAVCSLVNLRLTRAEPAKALRG